MDPRPFTGAGLDRVSEERKDAAQVQEFLCRPEARALVAGDDGVLVGRDHTLLRVPVNADGQREPILLGLQNGQPLFALELDALAPDARDGGDVVALREAGAELSHPEAGLAAYVTALLNWHRRHGFCANCGATTELREAGLSRRCPRCGAHHFPRTDPVVIMTVEHEDRLLLGRRAGWEAARMSVLAGFISPGESAEEAVVREVQEESGIVARDPRFVASQPWPFPASLMLGFEACADGGEPRATDSELEEVHWFSLDEVRAAVQDRNSDLQLPPTDLDCPVLDRALGARAPAALIGPAIPGRSSNGRPDGSKAPKARRRRRAWGHVHL